MDRRRFLELATVGSAIIAGCNSDRPDTASASAGSDTPQNTEPTETQSSTQSSSPTSADTEEPKIKKFRVNTVEEPGELFFEISAEDSRGITKVIIRSPQEELFHEFEGKSKIEISGSIHAKPGEENSVEAAIIDKGGNQVTSLERAYSRLHPESESNNWNIGCRYEFGGGNWDCKAGVPLVGPYDHSTLHADRQLDELTGHGINRLILRYKPDRDADSEQRLLNSPLGEDLKIEYRFDLEDSLQQGQLSDDLDSLRNRLEGIGSKHRAKERDRPVVTIASVYAFSREDEKARELAKTVEDEFGSFESLMQEMRTRLKIDGRDPYLVAELGLSISGPLGSMDYISWLESFDAITHALWLQEEGPEYEDAIKSVQSVYRNYWLWATDHNLDFIPVLLPGYDNRANDCWETESNRIKRNPKSFRSALAVAGEYASNDRLNVNSYNDWYDGTQIESGRTNQGEYGTSFLEAIGDFQQAEKDTPDRSIHYVSPDGLDSNSGSSENPLGTIGHAFYRAQPGDTIEVLPGRYHEVVHTMRPGEEGNPITLTGSPEAVFVGGDLTENPEPMEIMHSHIHVRGLTFDGLQDPERPDEIGSYAKANVSVDPIGRINKGEQPPYVSNVVIKPHAVGNTTGNSIHIFFGKDVEVGEFEVKGPAGVAHFVFNEPGHDGEIVYIGTSENGWKNRWAGYVDRTRDVHVHHIDNSSGQIHAEIADAKPGTKNVTVEYCTSVDTVSGQPAIHLGGEDGVARWNKIEGAHRDGITIGNWGDTYESVPDAVTGNAVYGNRIRGSGQQSIRFTEEVDPAEQGPICGNDVEQPADGMASEECPTDIPVGDGVGHLGGDSPWA